MSEKCCVVTVTGVLGCRWKSSSRSKLQTKLVEWLTFAVLVVATILNLMVMYVWIVVENDSLRFNWGFWDTTGNDFDAYSIFLGASILMFTLSFIIATLAILHFILKQQLYIDWFYKILIFVFLVYGLIMLGLTELFYPDAWPHVPLSMKFLAAFFQICAVVVMTFVTWPVAGAFATLKKKGQIIACIVGIVLYCVLLLILYLSPLGINSPCVIDRLPEKPLVIGHRGAEELAPENTLISFQLAAEECSVFGIESDVRISRDGIPYILHDTILTRTTDVKTVFPQNASTESDFFSISDLKRLNAGSWFIEEDPFNMVSTLSAERRDVYRNQTIPTLQEMLNLADSYNLNVIVDARQPLENHPYNTTWFEVILGTFKNTTSISDNELFYWFNPDGNALIALLKNFTNDNIVNKFIDYSFNTIKHNNEERIWTNIWGVNMEWVFSLYWCTATPSITTTWCHRLKSLKEPLWILTPKQYLTIWLIFDFVSVFWVIIIFIIQFRRKRLRRKKRREEETELKSR
ncbi:glycerophosphoinositol inositolphosphodiesterase GDPD2-like [Glandiceps talaboti]